MPYCTNCGSTIGDHDQFCAGCGARQTAAPPPFTPPVYSAAAGDNQLSAGCYLPWVGWIPCIYVLASERFRHQLGTRFHAFQGLYLFVAWLIADWIFSSHGWFSLRGFPIRLLELGLICTQLFCAFKTYHREEVRLPLLSELADKSVAEQR